MVESAKKNIDVEMKTAEQIKEVSLFNRAPFFLGALLMCQNELKVA